MRITQGAFSFLPDLTDTQIAAQAQYCIDNGWAVNIEFTDDPHPRNTYWDMWGHPMFDVPDAAGVMLEVPVARDDLVQEPGEPVRIVDQLRIEVADIPVVQDVPDVENDGGRVSVAQPWRALKRRFVLLMT